MAKRPHIPEPEPPETDPELEKTIADLLEVKRTARKDSAEYWLAMRQLAGLRYSYEAAGPIMEDLDPIGWGAFSDDLPALDPGTPTGTVLPLRRPRSRT